MPTLHIDVCEHAGFVTVAEMRRMIAGAVSKLKGDSPVTYTFILRLPDDTIRRSEKDHVRYNIPLTVSTMRRRFARILSVLNSHTPVTFSFHCKVQVN